ncbi:MAG: DNA polymerase III subunit [Chloroflexi bacterium]|nr:DNA polymerase III subunit [Chloroflexota bacterium]
MTTEGAAGEAALANGDPVPPGWRTFGHDGARKFLLRALNRGRLAHAYLLAGPTGIGKMSLALDLARAVNCLAGDLAARPCGACRPCQRITRGLHADVSVVDPDTPIENERARGDEPASRRVIRKGLIDDLEHRASLKPFEGRYRVFIIDGAEMMLAPAANALLKTLEEPESNVLIILLTPDPSYLPETIASRCQRIDLRPVPSEVLERSLVEKAGADRETSKSLARLAQGRPGWALAALTDPTALDRRRQGVRRVLAAIAGSVEDRFRYARNLSAVLRKDRDSVAEEMALWISWWRDVMLLGQGLESQIANSDFQEALHAVARTVGPVEAVRAVRAVQATGRALERNAMTPLVFEVMMLDVPGIDAATLPADLDGEGARDQSWSAAEES